MSKVCELCNKGPGTGHQVSHSVRRTKRRFLPNLVIKKLFNPSTGESQKRKVCMKCLKASARV